MTRTDPIVAVKLAEERAAFRARAERAEEAIRRVLEVHTFTDRGHFKSCNGCGRPWPCPTVRALGGRSE